MLHSKPIWWRQIPIQESVPEAGVWLSEVNVHYLFSVLSGAFKSLYGEGSVLIRLVFLIVVMMTVLNSYLHWQKNTILTGEIRMHLEKCSWAGSVGMSGEHLWTFECDTGAVGPSHWRHHIFYYTYLSRSPIRNRFNIKLLPSVSIHDPLVYQRVHVWGVEMVLCVPQHVT